MMRKKEKEEEEKVIKETYLKKGSERGKKLRS